MKLMMKFSLCLHQFSKLWTEFIFSRSNGKLFSMLSQEIICVFNLIFED